MVPLKTIYGEEKAWGIIAALSPEDICSRTLASYDPASGLYRIKSFDMNFYVSPSEKKITGDELDCGICLDTLKDFFKLSVLWYLATAKDIPQSGRLIKPLDVKGGQRFFTGTHVLPLDQIAQKYAKNRAGFAERGRSLGAELVNYGDVAIRLFPLPRVPVTLILWLEDEEFPARVDLLFDSTCEYHVPTSDIIWAIAMMSALIML